MRDSAIFIGVAQQHGFSAPAALAALAWANERLGGRGAARQFYIYRTAGGGVGSPPGQGEPPRRPRLLLAFPSADAALGFAQRGRLGAAPRLIELSLAQLLAVLVQRPTIDAVLFADDDEAPAGAVPGGVRIERAALVGMLVE